MPLEGLSRTTRPWRYRSVPPSRPPCPSPDPPALATSSPSSHPPASTSRKAANLPPVEILRLLRRDPRPPRRRRDPQHLREQRDLMRHLRLRQPLPGVLRRLRAHRELRMEGGAELPRARCRGRDAHAASGGDEPLGYRGGKRLSPPGCQIRWRGDGAGMDFADGSRRT